MIIRWLLLGQLLALGTTGYLYSKHTRTFVGRQGRLLSAYAPPLPFKIQTYHRGVMLMGYSGGQTFSVTGAGGRASEFRIEMNRAGEIRIRHGRHCETVRGGLMRSEQCRDSGRQRFVWVPAALFRGEAQGEGRPQPWDGYRDSPGPAMNPGLLANYIGIFCGQYPDSRECLEYQQYVDSYGDGVESESLQTVGPRYPFLQSNPMYRKRTRGLYAKGIDSTESGDCSLECVRNPQNNQCYYQMDEQGNLRPLMAPRQCSPPKKLCDLKSSLDRFFCEVAFKNDYSYFSKLLDDGL